MKVHWYRTLVLLLAVTFVASLAVAQTTGAIKLFYESSGKLAPQILEIHEGDLP